MKNIKLKMGATSIIITAVVVAAVILFNAIVGVVTQKLPMKIDLTKDKVYEFSNQTKDIMKSLDKEVKAYAIIPEGTENESVDYINAYLEKYMLLSSNFDVEYIDPYENPQFLNKYAEDGGQISAGSIIVECGDKHQVVPYDQMYTQSYFDDSVQIDLEKKMTNAIMNVSGLMSSAKIYFTQGHNEFEVENLRAMLTNEGYECADLSISREKIPEDADIIMAIAPSTDFTPEECEALSDYLENEGRFIITLHPGIEPMERMGAYLAEWGIKPNCDYVIEGNSENSLMFNSGMVIPAAKFEQHTITEKIMESSTPMAMPFASSATIVKTTNNAEVKKLLVTSEQAYGKTNLASTVTEKEEGDIPGPLCMAAISERGDANSAVLFIGSSLAIEYPLLL